MRDFELYFHQIAWFQVDTNIEGHTTLADLAPAPWPYGLGDATSREDADW